MIFTLSIYWNPSQEMFSWPIPILGRPILWYGFFFALGFFLAYLLFVRQSMEFLGLEKKSADRFAGSASSYTIFGMLIGARLGDILFYQGPGVLFHDPLVVFRFWEGGLASHGAAIGILVAVAFFLKFSKVKVSFARLLDLLAIPTLIAGAFIRLGNFFNQEIVGKTTNAPWGVVFGAVPGGPRHPVQLYEALIYLGIAGLLYLTQKKREGWLGGRFLILCFSARFFLEFFKERQSALLGSDFPLSMGQMLSIPFVLLGLYLTKGSGPLFVKRK